jgi:hypothetical protein
MSAGCFLFLVSPMFLFIWANPWFTPMPRYLTNQPTRLSNGQDYAPDADITDDATPGEIASLLPDYVRAVDSLPSSPDSIDNLKIDDKTRDALVAAGLESIATIKQRIEAGTLDDVVSKARAKRIATAIAEFETAVHTTDETGSDDADKSDAAGDDQNGDAAE